MGLTGCSQNDMVWKSRTSRGPSKTSPVAEKWRLCPFDWNNPFPISDLGGKCTTQWFRRVKGQLPRFKEADSGMTRMHGSGVDITSGSSSTCTCNGTWNEVRQQEWSRTVPYPLPRLKCDFNHISTNQVRLPGMNCKPRQARTAKSLDMQHIRISAICEGFGCDPSPASNVIPTYRRRR